MLILIEHMKTMATKKKSKEKSQFQRSGSQKLLG